MKKSTPFEHFGARFQRCAGKLDNAGAGINPKAGGFEQETQETAAPGCRSFSPPASATDPQAAINFYTSRFDSEKARFAGLLDAVWAQKSWLLFTKVSTPPPWQLTSAVWHFGWGAEDMKATYQRQLDMGTKFFTPLTDISDSAVAIRAQPAFSICLCRRTGSRAH
jgi:hypothetical protein